MTNAITKKGSTQALQAQMPALNGDEVSEAVAFQRDLVKEAVTRAHTSLWQVLFPSEMTKAVLKAEEGIVLQSFRTKAEALRCLDEAGLTMLRTGLDYIVACGCGQAVAEASSQLSAKRLELEANLRADWIRFCEAAVDERAWAEEMADPIREITLAKIANSVNGFSRMIEAALRKFDLVVQQTVGKP